MCDNLLCHKDALDLLGLTMLIYNIDKEIIFDPSSNKEGFISSINHREVLDNIKMSDMRKGALLDILDSSPNAELLEYISDADTDLQAAVTISHAHKRINIIFRGSESMSDWYYDLSFFKRQMHDDIYVHSGFYNQLTINGNDEKITTVVKKALEEFPDYSIYTCGHSLGGALCTLYGFVLSEQIPNRVNVVSFASPRVGNSGWKEAFDKKDNLTHIRFTNRNDIVTAFPMILYNHVGQNIRLEETKCTMLFDYSYSWWDYSLFKCTSVGDHSCDLYYTRLLKNKY